MLAGATPAALGLMADLSEAYPLDRGAIMGLYSFFLSLGQIAGSLIGWAAGGLEGPTAFSWRRWPSSVSPCCRCAACAP